MLVNDLLKESFPNIIDTQFTAHMEEELDEIARGEKPWVPVLEEFYGPFDKALVEATEKLPKMQQTTDEKCDWCGRPMAVKSGRFGLFLACSGYPEECFRFNEQGKKAGNTKPLLVKVGVQCPEDGGDLVEKRSRFGKTFYSCSNYPRCTFAMNLRPVPEPCPQCGGLLGAFPRGGVKCTKCDYKGRRPRAGGQAEPEAEKELVGAG
jgi:DNA topoisomerase-1